MKQAGMDSAYMSPPNINTATRMNQSMGELEGVKDYQNSKVASVTNRKAKIGLMS